MASERRSTLPAGRATLSAIPQDMVNLDASTATDSIDSNDSYKSQVPQHFYHSSHSSQSTGNMETPRPAYSSVRTMNENDRLGAGICYQTQHYGGSAEMGKLEYAFDGQLPVGMGLQSAGNGTQGHEYAPQPYGTGYGHGHNGELQASAT